MFTLTQYTYTIPDLSGPENRVLVGLCHVTSIVYHKVGSGGRVGGWEDSEATDNKV